MTIGWSKGIASQLSLPRRFISLPSVTSDRASSDGSVGCIPEFTIPSNRSGATDR